MGKAKATTSKAKLEREIASILRNTERSLEEGDADTIIALDAAEAKHKDAHKMLRGARATISIGSDRYAAKIVSVTPSMSTIVAEYTGPGGLAGEQMTFRRTGDGSYRHKKHYRLTIGHADTHWDPSF